MELQKVVFSGLVFYSFFFNSITYSISKKEYLDAIVSARVFLPSLQNQTTRDLYDALYSNSLQDFNNALDQFTLEEINKQDEKGFTPLMVAVIFDRPNMVEKLIERGADIKATYKNGDTPLMTAVENNYYNMVALLLTKGATVNVANNNKEIPILKTNNPSIIQLLVNAGADINALNAKGYPLLYYAATNNNLDLVTKLVRMKADVNIQVGTNPVPLLISLLTPDINPDIIAQLINAGADVNKPGSQGETALDTAFLLGNTDLAKLLINAGAKINTELINAPNIYGNTILLQAAENGDNELVTTLLNAGADVNQINYNTQSSALTLALKNKHIAVAKRLLRAHPDATTINAENDEGIPPLLYAISYGDYNLAQLLIDAGADVHYTFPIDNNSLLYYVLTRLEPKNIRKQFAELLINAGADAQITYNQLKQNGNHDDAQELKNIMSSRIQTEKGLPQLPKDIRHEIKQQLQE